MIGVIGPSFRFSAHLKKFSQDNADKITLQDLANEHLAEKERKKDKSYKTEIMKSCEYNQYIRDYLLNNSDKGFADAVRSWNTIRHKRGPKKYGVCRGQ